MSKWNLDEFVEVLNKEVPLSSFGEQDVFDKRRSDIWTARMVRTYFSKGDLTSPLKDGKYRFYNETHLDEFKRLVNLQYSGISYETANSILKNSNESMESIISNSGLSNSFNNSSLGFVASASASANGISLSAENDYESKKNRANEILKNSGGVSRSFNNQSHVQPQYWIK